MLDRKMVPYLMLPIALALPGAVRAQDYIPYVEIQAANIQYGNMLEKMYDRRDNGAASPRTGQTATVASAPRTSGVGGPSYFRAPAPLDAAPVSLTYNSTPALRRAAANAYVERVRKSNSEAGRTIADQIATNDFSKIYAGIVAPFGYRTNDAADALAAYTLLGWLIANGAPDPSRADAAAVRAQVAAGLANDRRFSDPRTRAELAEEMKLLFVTLHAGWQSARRDGNLKPYADGVATMFMRFTGNDLRAMRLTERGFVRG